MNAFDAARDVIFANEDRAENAQFFADEDVVGEPPVFRIMLGFEEPNAGLLQTDALVPGNRLWVRQSDLPIAPLEESFFVARDRKFVVRTAVTDRSGRWWICDVDERTYGS